MPQLSKADIYLDTNRQISPISPLLFSGFAEHMGRCMEEFTIPNRPMPTNAVCAKMC
jgi:hypothetical protein